MPAGKVFAYVAHGAKKLSALAMSPEGEFTHLEEWPIYDKEIPDVVRPGRFTAMCVSRDRRYLFASNRTAPYSIKSWAINQTDGTLHFLSETPTVESAPFLTTDRSDRYLLAAHNPPDRKRRDGYVTVSAIEHGFLQPPHQIIHTPEKTHCIRSDYSNRFVMAPACDADVIVRFGFDAAAGMLDPNLLANLVQRPKTGPRHFVFHPNNRFAYTHNEYDGAVYVYSFDARDFAMSEIQIAYTRPEGQDPEENVRGGDLHITPNGKFMYGAVRSDSSIAVMRIDQETGKVASIKHMKVDSEPRGFNIDPYGRFVVINGLFTKTIVTYVIDQETGELTKVASCDTAEDPNWIELVALP